MKKIYGYTTNIQKVSGIPYTNYLGYNTYANNFGNNFNQSFNNRYYRREREKEQKKIIKNAQSSQSKTIYKSVDPQIIYFMEYCKVRNTMIYNQLNQNISILNKLNIPIIPKVIDNAKMPDIRQIVINPENKYSKYAKPSKKVETNEIVKAYNEMNKRKNTIINFEERKKERKKVLKEEKVVPTKKQEMKQFKDSIRNQVKTEYDIAFEKFEKALKEKKKYERESRKGSFRVVKGRKNLGYERD